MSQISMTYQQVRHQAISVLTDALAMASDDSRDDPGIVHDLRVTGKRLRAWGRLMRLIQCNRDWQESDHRLRQIGRLLAPCRDRYVEHHTLDRLARCDSAGDKTSVHIATLQSHWADILEQTVTTQMQPDWEQVIHLLQVEQMHWRDMTIPQMSRSEQATALADAVKLTYRKTRMLSRAVAIEPEETTCHVWRKWTKHLLYQLELLSNVAPELDLNKQRTKLHAITDHMGDHHDFAMLARQLRDQAEVLDAKAVKRVLKLIGQQQRDLLKQARKKARHLFAEKPSVWVKTISQPV